ncbi:M23 family metallopeptidase [Fredinandcohnia quinoae]|uniref:M23 family metallopeptidase n=1 Tax=Fredinandcohnia quinoae TaxID=2918902 RepID=A0AAW5E5K2_9BACI|nr:M23 family metallopeptidase [Fredinandcohnia sp. SECRCQ15]MCH1625162.1 M23 family metallopeptidase [Fredinandcohnia sp. SECRCQ15]
MREEEKKRTSQKSSLQRFFRKRWVFPAIYLVSAAIILTAVLWFQSNNDVSEKKDDFKTGENSPGTANGDTSSIPVNLAAGNFKMPVIDKDAIEVFREFYDEDASSEKQEAALVSYENSYQPNKGIDIVAKDMKTFDVVASLGGTVLRAEKDSLHGHIVEIEHTDGIVTMYQSLANLNVKQGDTVEQGDVLGKAGQNLYDKDAGIHVHFELRNSGKAVNPLDYFGEPITSLEDHKDAADDKASEDEDKDKSVEEEKPDNTKTPADEDKETPPVDDENSEDGKKTNSTDASIGMAKA